MTKFSKEEIYEAKKEIVRAQVERFHEFYSEYFNRQETIRMVEFFFEKVYNLEGKQEWVDIAVNGFEKIKSLAKESTRESMEQLIELNNSTDELDSWMAELILMKGWKPTKELSREEYDSYFIEMGHEEERKKQLKFVLNNLIQFYELAHRPVNAVLLKPAKFMSKILGLYPLLAIVEEGYYAWLPVSKEIFDGFYKEVETKEWEYLNKCFPSTKKNNERTEKK
ncbi:MAG: hypothetical protein KDK36_16025 [Leptospiraceae bacterium]|nr:hypothetical protein [Leptospiraceae bacterium]